MTEHNPSEICTELMSRMRTIQLATIGEDGDPHCGYTPFLQDGTDFIVFISQLAVHTRDLLANPSVGTMLIDDENASKNLFARCRVRHQCDANVIQPDDPHYASLLDRYQERQGKVVTLIRQLPDFVLFRLVPKSGVLVIGFGEAYRIEGPNMDTFVHVKTA